MKKKYLKILVFLPMFVLTMYLNLVNSSLTNNTDSIKLSYFKTVFAQASENDPDRWLQTMTSYDAYCVDCWTDALGSYQVNCKCDQYVYDCDPFPEGDPSCTPYTEYVISNDCEPTGSDC